MSRRNLEMALSRGQCVTSTSHASHVVLELNPSAVILNGVENRSQFGKYGRGGQLHIASVVGFTGDGFRKVIDERLGRYG
jgi:hypothetical protein